jgi:homoaconitase/3-isopropylmalate dehydratase large subunit
MGFQQGEAMIGNKLITFSRGCTNGRIEDFRALRIIKKAENVSMAGSRITCCGSTNKEFLI